jgi:hypothetical protein
MTPEVAKDKPKKTVTIYVNNREVVLSDRDVTGAEIKTAAEVPADFQLYVEHGNKLELIQGDQEIKVHAEQRFRAVSGQDVS